MRFSLDVNDYIDYSIEDDILILDIKSDEKQSILSKFVTCFNYLDKDIINKSKYDLSAYHFKDGRLKKDSFIIRRFFKIGSYDTGDKNNICDVKGVMVGQKSLNYDNYHTGISVVKPCLDNVFKNKVVASSFAFNGFGKSIGLMQIEELGTIETNIAFTSTMNVGKVADAVVQNALNENEEIGESTGTVNPVVMECNDGSLSKSRDRVLKDEDYFDALADLKDDFKQGSIGAGCGMICHGFKGGIGSASRKVLIDNKEYTIGIILNSNFGADGGKDLIIKGHPYKEIIKIKENEDIEEKGSIVCCIATDAPLSERQIKRILKRIEIGIGRTGSYAGNGSGDVFIGFSTANQRLHFANCAESDIKYFSDNYINTLFKASVEMTEEAVLNSMMYAKSLKGYKREVKTLAEDAKYFVNLLDERIEWKD